MTQYSNQFGVTQEKGILTLAPNLNVINAKVVSTETGTLVPGTAVKLVDNASKITEVAVATASDAIFGFIHYNIRTDSYTAGDMVKVAFRDCVMVMEASEAVSVGAKVETVATGAKVAVADGTNSVVGLALDKATVDGDLIKVLINTPCSLSLTDLSDVVIDTEADTEVLKYDATDSRWENAADALV